MINLPIFRAKKLDSGEYVKGFLYQDLICYIPSDGFKSDEYKKAVDTETWFIMDNLSNTSMIDTTTLSSHFPDMLDSQGNEIFASLQKNGRGGDVCSVNDYIDSGLEGVAIYQNYGFRIDRKGKAMGISLSSTDIKITGIQQ